MTRATVGSLAQLVGGQVVGDGDRVVIGVADLRTAVTGQSVSPPLMESMAILGRERTVGSVRKAEEALRTALT